MLLVQWVSSWIKKKKKQVKSDAAELRKLMGKKPENLGDAELEALVAAKNKLEASSASALALLQQKDDAK